MLPAGSAHLFLPASLLHHVPVVLVLVKAGVEGMEGVPGCTWGRGSTRHTAAKGDIGKVGHLDCMEIEGFRTVNRGKIYPHVQKPDTFRETPSHSP